MQLPRCTIFVLILGAASHALGQIPAPKISRVTLYRDQALVSREITVSVAATVQEILVEALPERVVPDSVFAEASAGCEVRGVRLIHNAAEESNREEVQTLNREQQQLQQEIAAIQQKLQVVSKNLVYIDRLMNFSAVTSQQDLGRGVLVPATLTELTAFGMQQQSDLSSQQFAHEQQLEQLQQKVQRVTARLALRGQANPRLFTVKIAAINRGQAAAQIQLRYLVTGCGWSPQYAIRGITGANTFDLRYNAVIEQMTGENWDKVQLTLSTASPSVSAAGPSLTPFRIAIGGTANNRGRESEHSRAPSSSLGLRERQQAIEGQFSAKHSERDQQSRDYALNDLANSIQNIELQSDAAQLKSIATDAADDVTSQTYEVNQAVSLDSRREQQLVQILDAKLPGSLYYVATPILSSFAYREGDLLNNRSEGFLRGPATIYLDNQFVGRTEIPSIASGQHLVVGFGADQQVRTRRELMEKTDDVQGGNRRLTFAYRLVVANFKKEPITLRLYDRLPLAAQSAEVSLSVNSASHPLSNDPLYKRMQSPRGIQRWDLQVPANRFGAEAFDLEYGYSLAFDRNRSLAVNDNPQQLETDYREVNAPSAMGGMGGGFVGGLDGGGQP